MTQLRPVLHCLIRVASNGYFSIYESKQWNYKIICKEQLLEAQTWSRNEKKNIVLFFFLNENNNEREGQAFVFWCHTGTMKGGDG